MGAFFANLQIKRPDSDYEQKTIDIIVQYYKEQGYKIVDNEKDADKSIIIAREKTDLWYSIYDEDFDLNLQKANNPAPLLADLLKTEILSILVSDSDYLDISLHDKDKSTYSINNMNDNMEFTFTGLNKWNTILLNNNTIENIVEIFNNKNILVEEYLDQLAPLIGLSPLYCKLGYEYYQQLAPDKGLKLHFAKKEKELQVKPEQPNLIFSAYVTQYNLKIWEFHPVSFMISNKGALSGGMTIIMVGDAIEYEMIDISKMQIKIGGNGSTTEVSCKKTHSTDNRKIIVAELNNIVIPEGSILSSNASTKEYKKYIEKMYQSAITLNMEIEGIKQGEASFSVFAIPSPQGCGQSAYCEIEVTIE